MSDFKNHIVERNGRSYRVCIGYSGHVLVVALKPLHRTGRERYLITDGRIARELVAAAKAQND